MFNEVINKLKVRAPYNKVFNWAEALPKNTILKKQIQAENLFKKIGVTFSVYNNYDVSERLIPFDLFPRILSASEWIKIEKGIKPSDKVDVDIKYLSGDIKKIKTLCRIDTKNELEYYKNGGILQYVLRNMM